MTRPAAQTVASSEEVGALDWLLVALLCVVGAGAGILGVLLVPLYVGSIVMPVSVVIGVVVNLVLPRLGFGLVQTASGAVLPLVAWLIPTIGLVLYARPEGDVLVAGVAGEEWVLYSMILLGAVAGFRSVIVASAAMVRTLPPRR